MTGMYTLPNPQFESTTGMTEITTGGNPVSASNPNMTADQIRALILQGQGFSATTGLITTGVGAAFVGMQLLCNNVSKNVLIYNALITANGSGADARLYQGITDVLDAGLTANLVSGIVNQSGAANSSVITSLMGSPAATTQVGGLVGSQRVQMGLPQYYLNNLLQNESVVFIPKGTIGFLAAYLKVVTSGNQAGLTLEWVEF